VYTITSRKPTAEEKKDLAARAKPDVASYGCMSVLGVGTAWVWGKIGGWLGQFISPRASTIGQWLGWIAGAAPLVCLLAVFIPYDRKQRRLASRDHEAQTVTDIHVIHPRVMEISPIGNTAPILAVDIGDDTILYLQGQWLLDYEVYGANGSGGEQHEHMLNGLPAPYSFPSTEFTISRYPHSGEVIGIHVAGEYVAPEAEREAMEREYQFRSSELFSGSLEDIAEILAREHERRKALRT
jgi:hypothetical protein